MGQKKMNGEGRVYRNRKYVHAKQDKEMIENMTETFLGYDEFMMKMLKDDRFDIYVNIGMANNRSWRNDFAEFVRIHRNFSVDIKWKSMRKMGQINLVVITAGFKPDSSTKTSWTVWIIWCDQSMVMRSNKNVNDETTQYDDDEYDYDTLVDFTTYPKSIIDLFNDDSKRKYVFDDHDDLGPNASNVVNLRSIIMFHYRKQLAEQSIVANIKKHSSYTDMHSLGLADALNVATSLIPMARTMLRGAKHKTHFIEDVNHMWVPDINWNCKHFKLKQEATIISTSFLIYLLATTCTKRQLI